jgi:alpha-ketoglutarate-dependent taurine dioxygenase
VVLSNRKERELLIKVDTLWASGYELYDRLSPPYQKFLDGLDATFAQPGFNEVAKKGGFELYDKQRGAPENVGSELKAVHPVVRTNPVTGMSHITPSTNIVA